jgi:branched-subunit amino acid ABC-type transport system permease component
LGWDLLLPTFAAAIVGGIVNPYGAVVGAVLMGVVQNIGLIWIPSSYGQAIAFVAIALVLAFRPSGLFGQSARI